VNENDREKRSRGTRGMGEEFRVSVLGIMPKSAIIAAMAAAAAAAGGGVWDGGGVD